ncbi:Uncharacterised protein [uncultured Eubacterium sp.]|nr:unknown [Eubacterium sp. CAG:603]SCJ06831.1 Uncharacterised protein [uncultured Eubacterium sp.]
MIKKHLLTYLRNLFHKIAYEAVLGMEDCV